MKFEAPLAIDKIDLYRLLVVVGALALILLGCLIIIRPFIPGILLAVILTLSTWPAFIRLDHKLRHRRALSALLMTMILAAFFLLPLFLIGSSLADSFTRLLDVMTGTLQQGIAGEAPEWARNLPFAGGFIERHWPDLVHNREAVTGFLQTHAGDITQFLIGLGTAIGRGIFDVSLGVFISFFMFRNGAQLDEAVRNLIERFAGPRGTQLLVITKKTLIGVVYGILGTALAQGAVAAIGFTIAGVPGAPFLGLLTMLFSFIPIGPPIIWIAATIWLAVEGQGGMALFMGLWGMFGISSIDNVLRPFFISMGSKLPLLLVLFGAVGGVISFGFMGLFIGPTLLAVAYAIIVELSSRDGIEHKGAKRSAALPEEAGDGASP